jgi:phosphodiesterase/alkaline phosphatase D-like protein
MLMPVAALAIILAANPSAAQVSYQSSFHGNRVWVGPDYWTIRWQDWSVADGRLSVEARPNRSAVLLTHQVEPGDGTLEASVEVTADAKVTVPVGIWLGVNGPVDDWRSAGAYGEFRSFAGINPDGTLLIRARDAATQSTAPSTLNISQPFKLQLRAQTTGDTVKLQLRAFQNETPAGQVELELPASTVVGLSGLGTADRAAEPATPGAGAHRWHLRNFTLSGSTLRHHPDRTFGPIGWTQYTIHDQVLKMSVLMMPIGDDENRKVQLQLDRGTGFETVAEEPIDRMSRSTHFRLDARNTPFDVTQNTKYRVRYLWNGAEHHFDGTLRAQPTGPVKVALMSCDWGYAFPNRPVTASILYRDPDMVLYVGDQIYEFFGKHGAERSPIERSSLDYLRKYALFGWINRDILRDRPSIIIPDDHDVFQGNLWGAGGKKATGAEEMGGYKLEADWVNAIQRTQTWHIPDAVDPTPVDQGITVYFGEFNLGGISFAVLEDRKWKSGHRTIWKSFDLVPKDDVDAMDPPGVELLGPRQEKFLADWASRDTDTIKVAISQTMFGKGHTHSGPKLARNWVDLDTNGWPRSARNRAVSLLGKAKAIHLAGDQHVGILAQLGVENWTDGPLTFMVPGTANGWPRAWWPEKPGEQRLPGSPEYTGQFRDPFGNQMTILAAANPAPGANELTTATHTPEQIAEEKGSGFGLATIDPATKQVRFDMYRYSFDPANPQSTKQFEGFPQTFHLLPDGWHRIEK